VVSEVFSVSVTVTGGVRGLTVIRADTRTHQEIPGRARSPRYKRSHHKSDLPEAGVLSSPRRRRRSATPWKGPPGRDFPTSSWTAPSSPPTDARTRKPAGRAGKQANGTPARRTAPPATCRDWPPLRPAAVGLRHAARQHPRPDRRRELILPQARPYLNILPYLADSGFDGAGAGVLVPVKRPLATSTSTAKPATRCSDPCATRANAASC